MQLRASKTVSRENCRTHELLHVAVLRNIKSNGKSLCGKRWKVYVLEGKQCTVFKASRLQPEEWMYNAN